MKNFAQLLPTFQGKETLRKADAINIDIIDTIHADLPTAIAQVKNIAPKFRGETRTQTAKNIFDFLMQNVIYIKDADGKQIVKQPSALLAVGGDCKSFALFTVAVLKSLGLPAFFRYASYSQWSKTPTHVYAYTLSETGHPIIIDAVWKQFNSEKIFTFKKDYEVNISSMAGIGRAHHQHHSGQGKEKAKQVILAPARAPFLMLVKLNVRGLAHKLQRALAKAPDKVKATWTKLGGDFSKLQDAINKGKDNKPFLGEKPVNGIGVVGAAAVAAALTAAAPVIAAVGATLKSIGITGDKTEGTTDDILKDSGADKLDADVSASDSDKGGGGFMDTIKNLPTPVKIGGGALVAYGAAKAFKIIK